MMNSSEIHPMMNASGVKVLKIHPSQLVQATVHDSLFEE